MLSRINHLGFSYSSKPHILKDLSLSMDKGCFMGVLGPNGTGKSTFLKCINKIYSSTEGSIFIDDTDIKVMKLREIARKIAYVPQYTVAQFPTTVMNLVMMGRIPYSGYSFTKEDQELTEKALDEMGIYSYAMKDIRHLSGGERQRAFIARALVGKPKLILMDEPTSSLDIYHQLEVLSLVRNLVRKTEISVIMVIHDLNMAAMFCNRIVLLKNGYIWKDGLPKDTLTAENIEDIYKVKSFVIDKGNSRFIQFKDPESV